MRPAWNNYSPHQVTSLKVLLNPTTLAAVNKDEQALDRDTPYDIYIKRVVSYADKALS